MYMILVRFDGAKISVFAESRVSLCRFLFSLRLTAQKRGPKPPSYRAIRLMAKPPPGASCSFSVSPFFTTFLVMVYACGLVS